ncbi:hypothetical protein Smp_149090 [Schistosoma mansoni]|uniref:hypothetical protein n=1 Tax=Schistosoma mansoni TaxID=6183 RepID=UPI0001A63ABF|nr:hypothetical protein Smp_149090 [Schistosoma mansoni]|eukprot:XP_018645630.1 hypothetical protein Smp_149090 [Schistosoma mansoni]
MSLGSEACILKLKEEVYLLHDVVERVNKRANMKVAYSWKFPGKSAFETKILPVLSKCNFSTSNKPSNTMLHVFLLEMIIDRCLLIFQILSHLCKTVCHHLSSSNEDSNSLSSCVHEHVSVVSYLVSLISVNTETKEAVYLKYDEENHETSYEVERFSDRKIAADAIKWIADVERYYKSSSQAPSELTDKNENLQKLCDIDTIQPDEINLSSNPSCIIESCLLKFRHKLENTIDECQRISKLLEMKEMENQNMNSQLSMLTTKHEKLSTRLNQLTTLNEQLEEEIAQKENSIQYLNTQLTNSNQKVYEIENSLNNIKSKLIENEEIRKSIELNLEQVQLENKKLHEKLNKLNEDLLNMAQYPDLNGPITFENNEKSVDEELKGQIQANELRITLLVEQTKRLRNALLVINDKRQNMNNNHNNEIQFMEENTELLIIRPNSLSSLDNMSSDNRSVKEDNCRIRQKTYTKSNINSSEVNGNHPNVQLWSGPNTTRKGIVFLN